MDQRFGDWYRTAEVEPQHETLVKRQAGIDAYTADLAEDSVVGLARLFFGLSSDGQVISELQDAMHQADNAFSTQNNEIELRVLAGACLINIIQNGQDPNNLDAAFAAVCPALLGLRKSILVPDIPEQASQYLDKRSAHLRSVSGLELEKASVPAINESIEGVKAAEGSTDFSPAAPHLIAAIAALHSAATSLSRKLNQLERNQLLFREDSEILWWLTGEYSRDLRVPLSSIGLPGACILVGKELADLTETVPGPYAAQAVLDRCLQPLPSDGQEVSLSQAVNKCPFEWRKTWAAGLSGDELLRAYLRTV